MTRPLQGPLNTSTVDHSTDAYDTIDWLVKNVPESNGQVGMLGSSYEGFTVVMALVNPHPALEGGGADEPDGRRLDGRRLVPLRRLPPDEPRLLRRPDDGARLGRDDRARRATTTTRTSGGPDRPATSRRPPGSISCRGGARSPNIPPTTRSGSEQALDKTMAAQPLTVPTMWIQGLWDQEDMWGAIHSYLAVEPKDTAQRQELSRHGAVAAQPGELRRLVARPAEVGRRHRAAVPPRRAEAVLRSVPEGRRAEGRHAAGVHLQHRREPLGPRSSRGRSPAPTAAPRRRRRSICTSGFGLSFTAPAAANRSPPAPTTSTSPIRPSRCRTCRGRCASPTATPGGRWLLTRSALRRRSPRRADLCHRRR